MELKYKNKSLSGGSGQELIAGDGVTITESKIDVDIPVRGVFTQEEYDDLPDEKKETGFSVILDDEDDNDSSSAPGLQVYSTDETVVGKWINGLPIYRKTLTGTFTSTTNHLTDDGVIDDLITLYGSMSLSGAQKTSYVIPYLGIDGTVYCEPRIRNNDLLVYVSENVTGQVAGSSTTIPIPPFSYFITIEYTKTTDLIDCTITIYFPHIYDETTVIARFNGMQFEIEKEVNNGAITFTIQFAGEWTFDVYAKEYDDDGNDYNELIGSITHEVLPDESNISLYLE